MFLFPFLDGADQAVRSVPPSLFLCSSAEHIIPSRPLAATTRLRLMRHAFTYATAAHHALP